MRRSNALTAVRIALGIVFIAYGTVKVLGGQFYYGDWVIDKKTTDGPSLVWSFFGYSQVYGRFTGLFELVPGILLLIPRTATIGAAALFAVSINITVMDFAYGYPAVKYFALLYTILLAVLLWVDRRKLALLLEDEARVRSALAILPTIPVEPRAPMAPATRRILIGGAALLVLLFSNVLAASLSGLPTASARQALASRIRPDERLEVLQTRTSGLVGIDWTATTLFAVVGSNTVDTVAVRSRKITGFMPWRVEEVARFEAGASGDGMRSP